VVQQRLGQRIRECRLKHTGLSQEKFAHSIGMDRTYYASVERGRRNISIVNLEKIARGFGMTLAELLEGV